MIPYLVDIFEGLVANVKTELGLSNLNYQYGYRSELNRTLENLSSLPSTESVKKYPLVWLQQPFSIKRANGEYFGETEPLSIFIITSSSEEYTAAQRMTTKFKPILYPIYERLMTEIMNSGTITSDSSSGGFPDHVLTDRYYWGENQKQYFTDKVDMLEISKLKLKLYNPKTC